MTQINLQKQTEGTDVWLPRVGDVGGKSWDFGIRRYKLLYIGWTNNKVLLYRTVNSIQYPIINHNGKQYEKLYIYIYIYMYIEMGLYTQIHVYIHSCSPFAAYQRLRQHCKSTTLQYKKVIIHIHTAGDFQPNGCIFHCEDLKGKIITQITIQQNNHVALVRMFCFLYFLFVLLSLKGMFIKYHMKGCLPTNIITPFIYVAIYCFQFAFMFII